MIYSLGWEWGNIYKWDEIWRRIENALDFDIADNDDFNILFATDLRLIDLSLYWVKHVSWKAPAGCYIVEFDGALFEIDGGLDSYKRWKEKYIEYGGKIDQVSQIKMDFLFCRFRGPGALLVDNKFCIESEISCTYGRNKLSPRIFCRNGNKSILTHVQIAESLNIVEFNFSTEIEYEIISERKILADTESTFFLELSPIVKDTLHTDLIHELVSLLNSTEMGSALMKAVSFLRVKLTSQKSYKNYVWAKHSDGSIVVGHNSTDACNAMLLLFKLIRTIRSIEQQLMGLSAPDHTMSDVESAGISHGKNIDGIVYALKLLTELEEIDPSFKVGEFVRMHGLVELYDVIPNGNFQKIYDQYKCKYLSYAPFLLPNFGVAKWLSNPQCPISFAWKVADCACIAAYTA